MYVLASRRTRGRCAGPTRAGSSRWTTMCTCTCTGWRHQGRRQDGQWERKPDGAARRSVRCWARRLRRRAWRRRGWHGSRLTAQARHWATRQRRARWRRRCAAFERLWQRAADAAGGGRGEGEHRAQRGAIGAGGAAASVVGAGAAGGGRQRAAAPAEPARTAVGELWSGAAEALNTQPVQAGMGVGVGVGAGGVSSFGYSGTIAYARAGAGGG